MVLANDTKIQNKNRTYCGKIFSIVLLLDFTYRDVISSFISISAENDVVQSVWGKIPLINYSSKVFKCFITYFFLFVLFLFVPVCLTVKEVDISLKIKFKMFYCVQMHAAATDLLFLDLSYVKGPTFLTSCVLSKNLFRIFLKLSVFEKIYENLHFLLLGRARSNLLDNAVTWILQGWNE